MTTYKSTYLSAAVHFAGDNPIINEQFLQTLNYRMDCNGNSQHRRGRRNSISKGQRVA